MTDALPPPHTVDIAACTGEIHDQGAQVTRWAPAGSGPVLYVSSAVRFERGTAIRAGVPVCWPWALLPFCWAAARRLSAPKRRRN